MAAPAQEKRKLAQFFELGKVMGRGGFSVVRLAKRLADNALVAVKSLDKRGKYGEDVSLIRNEIAVMAVILEKVKQPNVVRLLDVFDHETSVHIVMELCKGGELFDRIVDRGHYSEADAAGIIRQISAGMGALHQVDILHRDLKPENLLFDTPEEDSLLKIMDFGLSFMKGTNDPMVGLLGSIDYLAPEVLLKRQYLPGTDMWAVGVIMYILLCGYPPFYAQSMEAKQQAITRGKYSFNDAHWGTISAEAKALIAALLDADPIKRPSAAQVLENPWVRVGGNASAAQLSRGVTQRLKLFNARRKFRVAGYAAMVGNMARMRLQLVGLLGKTTVSSDELMALQKKFNAQTSSSQVTRAQFGEVLRTLNVELPSVDRLFSMFDTNNDGTVDFREFVVGISTLQQFEGDAALRYIFDVYDSDGSGLISRAEMRSMLKVCAPRGMDASAADAEDWRRERLDAMFAEWDADGDGAISFPEFQAMLQGDVVLNDVLLSPMRSMHIQDAFDDAGGRQEASLGSSGAHLAAAIKSDKPPGAAP